MKLILSIAFALAGLAGAIPTPQAQASQCNTGTLQCCNTVGGVANPFTDEELQSLGVTNSSRIGVDCTPITNGNPCYAERVCCTDIIDGIFGLGCIRP